MGNSIHVCDGQGFAAVSHLRHELTHHLQRCRNQADVTCADRMKIEVEANLASGKTFLKAFDGCSLEFVHNEEMQCKQHHRRPCSADVERIFTPETSEEEIGRSQQCQK